MMFLHGVHRFFASHDVLGVMHRFFASCKIALLLATPLPPLARPSDIPWQSLFWRAFSVDPFICPM
jgi:hypothetical protein